MTQVVRRSATLPPVTRKDALTMGLAIFLRSIGRTDPANRRTCRRCLPTADCDTCKDLYAQRNASIYGAIGLATQIGYNAGFRPDPDRPLLMVAYIDLPDGQVSWHLPMYPRAWDGHDTATKYARCEAFIVRETGD